MYVCTFSLSFLNVKMERLVIYLKKKRERTGKRKGNGNKRLERSGGKIGATVNKPWGYISIPVVEL